jgi:hypothetical protein
MLTSRTTVPRQRNPGHHFRHLTAPACALALVLLLAGNVAAHELTGDSGASAAGPRLDRSIENLHLRFKLATNAGHDVLVRG